MSTGHAKRETSRLMTSIVLEGGEGKVWYGDLIISHTIPEWGSGQEQMHKERKKEQNRTESDSTGNSCTKNNNYYGTKYDKMYQHNSMPTYPKEQAKSLE